MPLLLILCLISPFALLIVEIIFPFPYIVEELFKFFVVKNLRTNSNYFHPLLLGIVFSLSESALYLVNFFKLGNFSNFPLRILLTTMLHSFTFLMMYTFKQSKNISFVVLLFSIFIHYLFNQIISLGI